MFRPEGVARPLSSVAAVQLLSRVQLFLTSWTPACQAPLSVEFSRQEYWSGLLLRSPGALPNPGMEPTSPALAGGSFTAEPPEKPLLSLVRDKRNCTLLSAGKKPRIFCTMPWSSTSDEDKETMGPYFLSKRDSGLWNKGWEEKTFRIHSWSLRLCSCHRTHVKGPLHGRHMPLQFPWAGLRWPHFCVPFKGGVHRSSTVLTLSNRHSWLAFPSHSRKYRSLLFSCTTASMHFPERMWTIIPFWKERRKGKKYI